MEVGNQRSEVRNEKLESMDYLNARKRYGQEEGKVRKKWMEWGCFVDKKMKTREHKFTYAKTNVST
jgi:hypothetical protein